MNLLFVCAYGRDRSPTAAAIYREIGYDVRYGGYTPKSYQQVMLEDLAWAEQVVVFSAKILKAMPPHLREGLRGKAVTVLGIENRYLFGATRLQRAIVAAMRTKLPELDHPEPDFTMVMRQRP